MLLTYALKDSVTHTGYTHKQVLQNLFGELPEVELAKHSRNYFKTRTIEIDTPVLRPIDEFLIEDLQASNIPKQYLQFNIPKHSGGYRTINAPHDELCTAQRAIADWFNDHLKVLAHDAAYAYCRGRSAYDALVTHQHNQSRWFLKLDIKDFFPSITEAVLKEKLPQLYPINFVSEDAIDFITDIATLEGSLPQGSPLSPLLSNLVLVEFDKVISHQLWNFNKQKYVYTRYADDILISSRYHFKFMDIVDLIEQTFTDLNLPFNIKHEKTRYGNANGRNWNLGLMYNKDMQITIGTKRKKRIAATLHQFIMSYPEVTSRFSVQATQELIGQLSYMRSIEPGYYKNLVNKYEQKYQVNLRLMFKETLNTPALPIEDDLEDAVLEDLDLNDLF